METCEVRRQRESESESQPHELRLAGSHTSNGSDICRICHMGNSESELISACRCIGSVRYTHPECITKWLNFSNLKRCELCRATYNIRRCGLKPMKEWRLVDLSCMEQLHLSLLLFCICTVMGSLFWWKSFVSSNGYVMQIHTGYGYDMKNLIFITYGSLNVMCIILALLEIRFTILPIVNRWTNFNQDIRVMAYKSKHRQCPEPSLTPPASIAQIQVAINAIEDVLRRKPKLYNSADSESTTRIVRNCVSSCSLDGFYKRASILKDKPQKYQKVSRVKSMDISGLSIPETSSLSSTAATGQALYKSTEQPQETMPSIYNPIQQQQGASLYTDAELNNQIIKINLVNLFPIPRKTASVDQNFNVTEIDSLYNLAETVNHNVEQQTTNQIGCYNKTQMAKVEVPLADKKELSLTDQLAKYNGPEAKKEKKVDDDDDRHGMYHRTEAEQDRMWREGRVWSRRPGKLPMEDYEAIFKSA